MTTEQSNNDFQLIEKTLYGMGFGNIKRWVEHKPEYKIIALEVYCSPILMFEKVYVIAEAFPHLNVSGNTNQSYILIKRK